MDRWLALLAVVAILPGIAPANQENGPSAEGPGILLEMERFDSRTPSDDSFATAANEAFASGRKTLTRFFVDGRVAYRFEVPSAGRYFGWIRYGSKGDVPLRWALDPRDDPPRFETSRLPATGGYLGPGVWQWARLWEADLEAGPHALVVGSASIRPDCIYISPSPAAPDDEFLRARQRVNLPPEIQRLVDRPLVAVRPEWLDGAEDYRLPRWYEAHRVHAHTRLSLRHVDGDVFFRAAEGFRQMGARVFTRHIKSGDEGAWWPSAVGAVHPAAQTRNLAKQIIDGAHAEGCRILVYHRHMEDRAVAEAHPEWVCRDRHGEPLRSNRGAYLCLNSPYPDYFLTRSLELAALGADGFYYDEVHMPKTGCWCDYCKKRFKEETGLDHPASADPEDPVWHKLIDFNNLTIERAFLTWREAIHERYPDLVMLIGSNTWPTISDRHTTGRLYRIADAMKTEFSLPARTPPNLVFPLDPAMRPFERDAKIALGYTLARDACGGRPPHVWCHGLLDATSALYATAGMVAHGCIANLDIPERSIPNPIFRPAYELGAAISPYFAGTRPVRWVAIHYSERTRDRHVLDPYAAWEKVLYPTYGAYLTLLRARLPIGIVTDSQLEDGLLDGYGALFLPAPDGLTEPMREQVERFGAGGGLVIEQRAEWRWHDPEQGHDDARRQLLEALGWAVDRAPVRVAGGPEKMHAVAFRGVDRPRLTVALVNDFSWVDTGSQPRAEDLPALTQPPPASEEVRVLLRGLTGGEKAFDAVSGETLAVRRHADGAEISVPPFAHMAVVVIQGAR